MSVQSIPQVIRETFFKFKEEEEREINDGPVWLPGTDIIIHVYANFEVHSIEQVHFSIISPIHYTYLKKMLFTFSPRVQLHWPGEHIECIST